MASQPTNVVEIKDPTPDQRLKIRSALDKSFDDGAGAYLDDMSDDRIAEAVGVPRVVVSRIREAAYGPIKVDPEVVKLHREIDALKAELKAAASTIQGIDRRLAEIGVRVGSRAA